MGRALCGLAFASLLLQRAPSHTCRQIQVPLLMQAADEPTDEWRAFRARLVSRESVSAGASSPENEARLRLQNEPLWAEYRDGGSWAHPVPSPERGGLLCALPLQGQLVHMLRKGDPNHWAQELHARLMSELPEGSTADDALFERWLENTGERTCKVVFFEPKH